MSNSNAAAIKNLSCTELLLCFALYNLTESRNQSLSQPEAENQLGTGHQQLGGQTLEEAGSALVLHHVGDDAQAGLGVLEVAVLDAGLDHVKRGGHDQGGRSTGNGGNEVLAPGGLVVVLQTVDVLLGESRSTEEL